MMLNPKQFDTDSKLVVDQQSYNRDEYTYEEYDAEVPIDQNPNDINVVDPYTEDVWAKDPEPGEQIKPRSQLKS